jgi:hypothetical protein
VQSSLYLYRITAKPFKLGQCYKSSVRYPVTTINCIVWCEGANPSWAEIRIIEQLLAHDRPPLQHHLWLMSRTGSSRAEEELRSISCTRLAACSTIKVPSFSVLTSLHQLTSFLPSLQKQPEFIRNRYFLFLDLIVSSGASRIVIRLGAFRIN